MPKRTVQRNFYLKNICVSLGLGVLNYLLFRPDTRLVKMLQKLFSVDFSGLLAQTERLPTTLTIFCKNFLSDMLWAYALIFAAAWFVSEKEAFAAALVFSFCTEAMQAAGFLAGTFDRWDIALEWLAIGIGRLAMYKNRKNKEDLK